MKIRPGKTRSLIAGVLMLVIMIVGLLMMPSQDMLGNGGLMGRRSPLGGAFSAFRIAWIAVGVIGAGASFYNAFSKEGVPLYEIDTTTEDEVGGAEGAFCPKCGKPVSRQDKFCRNCGATL